MNEGKQPCGCGQTNRTVGPRALSNNLVQPAQVLLPGCTPEVSTQVCVEADVTVTPSVVAGTPTVNCVGNPQTVSCQGRGFTPSTTDSCVFTVSQVLCVSIPITFDAEATAVLGLVACGEVFNGPDCQDLPGTSCTLTRGFYLNHPTETLQLLAIAGGTITLGTDNIGLSLVVTATNIFDVLSGDVGPSPQYQQLYTQLLTAKLNVLNGATCQFATDTIALADTFLLQATINNAVASLIQEMLADFNEGNAQGCPGHCEDDTVA